MGRKSAEARTHRRLLSKIGSLALLRERRGESKATKSPHSQARCEGCTGAGSRNRPSSARSPHAQATPQSSTVRFTCPASVSCSRAIRLSLFALACPKLLPPDRCSPARSRPRCTDLLFARTNPKTASTPESVHAVKNVIWCEIFHLPAADFASAALSSPLGRLRLTRMVKSSAAKG